MYVKCEADRVRSAAYGSATWASESGRQAGLSIPPSPSPSPPPRPVLASSQMLVTMEEGTRDADDEEHMYDYSSSDDDGVLVIS